MDKRIQISSAKSVKGKQGFLILCEDDYERREVGERVRCTIGVVGIAQTIYLFRYPCDT